MEINLKEKTDMVKNVWDEQTGGGCIVTFVELTNGKCITISDDCLIVRESVETFGLI